MMNVVTLRDHGRKANTTCATKTFIGYYIPFAGVRYYAFFNEHEVAEGRAKIGPVGWRRDALPTDNHEADEKIAA